MKQQVTGATTANARETRIGRTTVTGLMLPPPRFDMTWTITRPTTSSIMAALVKTTPSREDDNPLAASTVKVVPRLVEQSAAPAAKAWRGVAPRSPRREKESAIGRAMPVTATAEERRRLALRDLKEVERPPGEGQKWKNGPHAENHTFID
jgi:hypothetical protein